MDSEVVDHCQSFALSDLDNVLFQKKCNHDHVEICSECYKLNDVLADIEIACSKLVSEEEIILSMVMDRKDRKEIIAHLRKEKAVLKPKRLEGFSLVD